MNNGGLLESFLNIEWLRPEGALWDAIAAHVINTCGIPLEQPALDFGAGNGLFSFAAAGGKLSLDYDFYINAGNLDKFWDNEDIYDNFLIPGNSSFITKRPARDFAFAFDHKKNLMQQASFLRFYKEYKIGDANGSWPYESQSLKSFFSNMLYWLQSPEHCFSEITRILQVGGHAFLCLQDPRFKSYCDSYRSDDYPEYASVLKKLNRGRTLSTYWQYNLEALEKASSRAGLKIIHHRKYLTKLVLKIWDIGLRPLSPVLIKMANSLSPQDRKAYKEEWIQICSELLGPIFDSEKDIEDDGGYIFLVLEKT